MITPVYCELFDSSLHQQWKQDRALRRRVPRSEAWRGCVGLGALVEGLDAVALAAEGPLLLANQAVRWMSLRDIPTGRFPGSAILNRRDVNFASSTQATLRHGCPRIDFSQPDRHSCDFRFYPHGAYRQAVVHYRGRLLYVAYSLDDWQPGSAKVWDGKTGELWEGDSRHLQAFLQAGMAQVGENRILHPQGDTLDSGRKREFALLNGLSAAMTRFAFHGLDGRNRPMRRAWAERRSEDEPMARVPLPRQWMPRAYLAFAQEQIPVLKERLWATGFPLAFRDSFCEALAQGLPLRASEPMTYLGPVAQAAGDRGWVMHRFRSDLDGRSLVFRLPNDARLYLFAEGEGETPQASQVRAGGLFGRAMQQLPPAGWRTTDRPSQWARRQEACGSAEMLHRYLELWFGMQGRRVKDDPQGWLLPAELVSPVCSRIPPVGLWWDFAPARAYYQPQAEAFVFPPLRVLHWERLRFWLPGDVDLDASIGDPRFTIRRCWRPRLEWTGPREKAPASPDRLKASRRVA